MVLIGPRVSNPHSPNTSDLSMYAVRQRPASGSNVADEPVLLVFPSPNVSLSDISDSQFTLLEGSSDSFLWSDSEVSTPQHPPAPPATPQPVLYPRRIPLLAFWASLLAIDDATLHLLAHPRTHSPLFPGPPLAHPDADPDTQHGLLRLGRRRRALEDGMAVAFDSVFVPANPFVSPFHLVHSWAKTLLTRG
ncbi:hypothetical protein C8R44DRAFT_771084 [Mycena epipterygia]|nr:hypothetical protein C8R44DRAFT_771084 [Mycena epipterygia]